MQEDIKTVTVLNNTSKEVKEFIYKTGNEYDKVHKRWEKEAKRLGVKISTYHTLEVWSK